MIARISLKSSTIYEMESISKEVHRPRLISAEEMIKCTVLEQSVPASVCFHISGKVRANA